MKPKKVVLLILLLVFFFVILPWISGRILLRFTKGGTTTGMVESESWLRLNAGGLVPDYSELQSTSLFKERSVNSVQNMCRKIRQAAGDSRIKGLILEPMGLQISLAGIGEIGLAIKDFKASGKPVYAAFDTAYQGDYLLASFADEIYMEPSESAGLMLSGSSANVLFYKDMLDKFGVKMHVIQAGEYKGAGEPFLRRNLSEGTRQNISQALLGLYENILQLVAENREITLDDARSVYNDRPNLFIQAAEALEMKLIDHALSRPEMYDKLGIKSEKLVKIADYKQAEKSLNKDKIAVLYLSGAISPAQGSYAKNQISYNKVRKATKKILGDKSIKAVVVRVDSPGGSALESEYIYQELLKLKAEKPLVISMGGTAASGGYYISCAADEIFADAGTITGSIGVIMVLPEFTAAARKLGVDSQSIKHGKYAGALNPLEPYSQELLGSLKQSAEGTYTEFKQRVMNARGIGFDKINSIAEGRIYNAADALALGLVDEIGSLLDACTKAAEMAGISEYSFVNYPETISLIDAFKELDFMSLSAKIFKQKNLSDLPEHFENYLNTMEMGTWQYLMPIVVE